MKRFGLDMSDPVKQWNDADSKRDGRISFFCFCEWAIR